MRESQFTRRHGEEAMLLVFVRSINDFDHTSTSAFEPVRDPGVI